MTDSRKIISNSFVVGVGQVLNMLLNFLTMIVLARSLDQDQFGLFSYALIFIGYFAILPDFGMKPTLVREVSKDESRANIILSNSFFIKLIFSFAAILVCILSAKILKYPDTLFHVIISMTANIFISSKLIAFRILLETPFETKLQMRIPILLRLLDSFIQFALIVFLTKTHANLSRLTAFYVAGSLPGFIACLILFLRRVQLTPVNMSVIKEILVQSVPIALYVIFTRLYYSSEFFIIKLMKSEYDLGIYSAAYRLITPLDFIPAAIIYSLYPLMSRLYQSETQKMVRYFATGFKVILLLGLFMAVFVSFNANSLINLIYSEKYIEAAPSLVLLAWAEFLYFIIFLLVDFNNSIHRQKINAQITLMMMILNIVLNLILIPRISILGAGISKVITVGLGLAFYYKNLPIKNQIGGNSLFFKSALIAGVLGVFLFFAKSLFLPITLGLACIVFILGIKGVSFFSPEEEKKIRGLIRI